MRAFLASAPHFCRAVVLKLRSAPLGTALSLTILEVSRRGALATGRAGRGGDAYNAGLRMMSLSDTVYL